MRILQLVSARKPNGAALHALDLSRELSKRGHEVLFGNRLEKFETARLEGQPITPIDCNFKRWPGTELRRIAEIVRSQRVDLIHTHMSSAHLFGVLLRRLFGIPCVATAHCSRFQPHWRWNDHVLAVSRDTHRYHQRFNLVPARRIQTVYAAFDTVRFVAPTQDDVAMQRDAWNLAASDRAIGVVGDVVPRKGQLELVRALPEILARQPNLKLVIVGGCETDVNVAANLEQIGLIRQAAAELNVADRIVWNGYSRKIPQVMRSLDACIVPSLSEPFGLVAAEALAAGTPVVAHRVGGLPEIVDHGVSGMLLDNLQPTTIAEAVDNLFQDESRRRRFGEVGHHKVTSQFSVEQQLTATEAIYQSVMDRHSNRRFLSRKFSRRAA